MFMTKHLLHLACEWHFHEIMKRRFSGPTKDPTQYEKIMQMQKVCSPEVFETLFKFFLEEYGGDYFEECYGHKGSVATPKNWARCYNYSVPSTSMQAEVHKVFRVY